MTKMQLHPLCTLFPRLEGSEFDALREDIRANGLRQPIVVHDEMILDGGNRYRACVDAGVAPKFIKFDGKNLVSFVLSANLHRRHMSAGQQAAIVALATDWEKASKRGGNGSNQHEKSKPEGLPVSTVASRAAISGATERTQRDADKLVREAPKLAREVTQGTKSLYQAVKESKPLPKIVPRNVAPSKPVSKPEVDPATKLRAELKTVCAELAAERAAHESTKERLSESRENAAELADSLQSYVSAEAGTKEAAEEIKRLLGVVRVLEATRDQYMTTCTELKRTVKSLERKLGKKP